MILKITTQIFYENKVKIHFSYFCIVLLLIFSAPIFSQDIPNNSDCEICAGIHSYPQLASIDTDDGLLSQLIFNQLLGIDMDLTTLNWQGITQSNFEVEKLMLALAEDLDISSTKSVLEQDLTINQILSALTTVAENDGTVLTLNEIMLADTTTKTIQLKDMLVIDVFDNSLSNINLDFFSFLNTVIQLYNFKNVFVTNDPLDINLPVLGDISLQAQVVEPPNIICSKSQMQLFSAGIRLKLDVDIINANQSSSVTVDFTNIGLDLSLTEIELYVDIARGLTTINQVNGPGGNITIDGEPGLARMFLGTITESDFFDRAKDPIDYLQPGKIGNLDLIIPILPDVTLDITAEGSADAVSLLETINNLSIPFNVDIGNSATTISELVDELLVNTDIQLTSNVPFTPLVTTVVGLVQDDIATSSSSILFAENGVIHDILGIFVDPLLKSLGVAIGELILKGHELIETCFDFGDAPISFGTLLTDNGPMHAINDNIFIGSGSPESDADGTPDDFASADDGDDGISNIPGLADPTTFSMEINVVNMSKDSAQLIGWIDFNDNGVFENNYERSVFSTSGNVDTNFMGIVTLNWENIPGGSNTEEFFTRIRLSSDPVFFDPGQAEPTGFLMNGEVEDHLINNASLPVELLSFHAIDQGQQIQVAWKTINEIGLREFQLERSFNGIDFELIHTLSSSQLEDNRIHDYNYNDYTSQNGNIYYRLKSVDWDGTFSLSQIQYINRISQESIDIFPNPCSSKLHINTGNKLTGDKIIKIYNSNYQLMSNSAIPSHFSTTEIDISGLTNGVYYVSITYNNKTENKMIIKN